MFGFESTQQVLQVDNSVVATQDQRVCGNPREAGNPRAVHGQEFDKNLPPRVAACGATTQVGQRWCGRHHHPLDVGGPTYPVAVSANPLLDREASDSGHRSPHLDHGTGGTL